ncbi:MAG TPA: S8 family serine peptidase [Candidatus Avipropionibacterium avicola]|uniref:S8 family serine peptidase n=1 Tax=Candidatus Avipropionibacterium avicola TaxID=2840701 RepID=A0A9D1H0P0_9ACTN|nr:S8 family serine peptidase [Candidatus Avipropionibacterium avicola]
MAGRRAALSGAVLIVSCLIALVISPVQAMAAAARDREPDAGRTNFVVLAPEDADLGVTERAVRHAGGRVLQSWDAIGVVVATSGHDDFADRVRAEPGVSGAGATRDLAAVTKQDVEPADEVSGLGRGTSGGDDRDEADFDRQWNLRMIRADAAHRITDGDRSVVVGILDTGIDPSHPDLADNIDPALSVGCTADGIPDGRVAAWQATSSGHGTHVAGIVGAVRDGEGIVGIAPNVRLASVKVVDNDGYIYPEYALCGILWAAEHEMDVTNNSYLLDPWTRWCGSDPDQAAVQDAMRRALSYSERQQVVTIASAGNDRADLTRPLLDRTSPSNGNPELRRVEPECRPLPSGAPTVVAVSAVGPTATKAYYSNYGAGAIGVTAPGGDAWLDWRAERPVESDTIWSTEAGGGYSWMQGTSMASPHVAGVVALMRSVHPELTAAEVRTRLQDDARTLDCPTSYDFNEDGRPDAVCEGGAGEGFYGAGLVDALAAVTR